MAALRRRSRLPGHHADLDRLREGGAADYLLQTVPDNAGPRTRLFHQALSDELLARRHRRSDEHALLTEGIDPVRLRNGFIEPLEESGAEVIPQGPL